MKNVLSLQKIAGDAFKKVLEKNIQMIFFDTK
jgi:hypothetical protein